MLNAILYVRVSQVGGRDGDGFRSPGQQETDGREWVAANKGRVIDVVTELDASGGDGNRPGWQAVLARAEAGEADAVVCYDLARFSRDMADGAAAIKRMDKAGARLVAIKEHIDTADASPQGRYIVHNWLA